MDDATLKVPLVEPMLQSPKRCGFKLPPLVILCVFCYVNLLNYLDRGLVAGILPELEDAFKIDDTAQGVLAGAFMAGYALFSPIMAFLANYYPPFILMSAGLGAWVASTMLATFAPSYGVLVLARILSGLGEAGFQNIGPPFIDDSAPTKWKGVWLAIFFCCIPVGQALGFIYGGLMSHIWRWAFFFEGIAMAPVVITGLLVTNELRKTTVGEPKLVQGQDDEDKESASQILVRQLKATVTNWIWLTNALGYGAFTYVVGAFAFWAPTYIHDVFDITLKEADWYIGGVTVFAGLVGTACGGAFLDFAVRKYKNTNRTLIALTEMVLLIIAGIPLCISAFLVAKHHDQLYLFLALLGLGEFMLLATTSATNAVFLWAVPPDVRPFSMALSVVIMHGTGDVPSPTIIGAIQDRLKNWQLTMLIGTMQLVLCAFLWFLAAVFTRSAQKRGVLFQRVDVEN